MATAVYKHNGSVYWNPCGPSWLAEKAARAALQCGAAWAFVENRPAMKDAAIKRFTK